VEHAEMVPQQEIFSHFMQPKRPLLYSQELATSLYPMTHDLGIHPANPYLDDLF
jgi:hypothetical protein